jgi:amino acid transporter
MADAEAAGGGGGGEARGAERGGAGWTRDLYAALVRRKPISRAPTEAEAGAGGEEGGGGEGLRKSLTLVDLLGYGVGTTVGAGIYSLLGPGSLVAGPGIVLSFLAGAVSCVFTGLAYSEFAARCPVSGSAYTYAYTSFGEGLAWVIGWNLTLEYAVSAAAIARGWADYVAKLADLVRAARDPHAEGSALPAWLHDLPLGGGGAFSFSALAGLVVLLCTGLMLVGVGESSKVNVVITAINVLVLVFVVACGAAYVRPENWVSVHHSFVPYGAGSVFAGAGTIFFSFLGFDMVSSLAEEVRDPQRNMPLGIIGSLSIATVIYVSVSLVATGMVPFLQLGNAAAPLAFAFQRVGLVWASWVVSVGSLFGLTAATFTCLFGQPRIFYRMATDGLLFPLFAQVDARGVPRTGTLITGVLTATIAVFFSLGALADAISVGTLCAFTIVDAGVVFMRFVTPVTHARLLVLLAAFIVLLFAGAISFHLAGPWAVTGVFWALSLIPFALLHRFPTPAENLPSTFLCPFVPTVPLLGIAINVVMLAGLNADAWIRLVVWTALGALLYGLYGFRHSKLATHPPRSDATAGPESVRLLAEPEEDNG